MSDTSAAAVTPWPEGPITVALAAQDGLQPGQPGYWKVWGALASDIQPGDLVMVKYEDTGTREYEVTAPAPRGDGDLRDLIRPRFRAATGELFHIGALQPVIVLRHGTCHTLAGSVR
jgi:hypothetical protein